MDNGLPCLGGGLHCDRPNHLVHGDHYLLYLHKFLFPPKSGVANTPTEPVASLLTLFLLLNLSPLFGVTTEVSRLKNKYKFISYKSFSTGWLLPNITLLLIAQPQMCLHSSSLHYEHSWEAL